MSLAIQTIRLLVFRDMQCQFSIVLEPEGSASIPHIVALGAPAYTKATSKLRHLRLLALGMW